MGNITVSIASLGIWMMSATSACREASRDVQVAPMPRARNASISDQAAGRMEPK